ncbi:spermatogenesis-associated protein 31D1-like [Onychomys torridus]|uniref:spermatogenesis-associated protein 31D1-like n=1 Tax=Onychomys torridus TaxID=38674 RepID=UPI00167FB300|nr:spermatogenesis-associated protein 31D1-like [Onychomys torridus]
MEKVISFLHSATEPWLSFGHLPSAFMDIYPKCIFLSAVGVFLLYLRYLLLKPFLPTWNNRDIRKQQGKAKKGRRATSKEFRIFHREAWERRKLLSVVQSPLGRLYDASHFRQVLCPDPCCDVCNGATAKVSHLLSWATLEDGAASASSVPSTASVTEDSFTLPPPLSLSPPGGQTSSLSPVPSPPPPTLSANTVTPLEDILLYAPQGDSPPSEPVLLTSTDSPLDHIPSPPLPTFPQAEGSLRLETTPSVVGSPREWLVSATANKEACGDGDVPAFSPESECLVNSHSSKAFLGGQTTDYFTMPGKLSFPSPEVLVLLERRDGSQADFLMRKDGEEKAETFQKALTTWEEIPESTTELQNSGGSLPLGGSKSMLSELIRHQGFTQAQTTEDQSEPKFTQRFWGLPYLHSESMNAISTLSAHCSSTYIWFNGTPDSSVLTLPTPLSLPESPSQMLAQSQSQSVLLAMSQTQFQPPIPGTFSSQSQLRICGVYFHRSQDKTKTLLQAQIHHLECSIMTKVQERVWGLPSVVQKSQEDFCLLPSKPSLVRQSSETHAPRSVPPEDFPLTDAFRRKLERHLQKRFILQRWGLPQRIFKSQPWLSPDLSESPPCSYGLSWTSFLQHQESKDPHDTESNQPGSSQDRYSESLSLEGKMVEAQGHSPEIAQRCLWSNTKGALANGLQSDCETNLQCHPGSLSGKPSGTSEVSQCQKKLETALQKHLIRHLNETNEDHISGTVSRSGHCPLPFTLCIDKEEHEAQRQLPSDNKDGHVKSTYTMTKSVLHQVSIGLDNIRLKESEGNRHSSDVPRISTEAGLVPLSKQLDSSKTVQGPQGTKMNDKNTFVSNKVSNIVKRGQLSGLQPQPTKILNTSQWKSAQGADGNTTKAQSTLVAGRAQKEIPGFQESQTSDCNSQVSREEKFKVESRLPIQALGSPNDMPPASDKFTYKPLLMHDQSPSSGPMNASQVQWVHLSTTGLSVEQQQEPWMHSYVLDKGQDKDFPPSAQVWPAMWKTKELGAGITRSGTLQANGKSCHLQDSPSQGNYGEKPARPLPPKALTPPEHQFRKHIKHFLQWISPDRKCKGQETFPRKGTSPSPPVQDPELWKGRATLPGNTVAQKATRVPGKVPKEQLGHRHIATDTMYPRVPLSPPIKPVKTNPKKVSWVPAEPVQGRPFHHQATCPKVPSPRAYNQATAFVGQKRWVEDRDRQSQKSMALQPHPPAPYR